MSGWPTESLGELCAFQSGLWTGKTPPFQVVNVLRNTNFRSDGFLSGENIASLDVEERQFASRRLQPGDIILEKSGGGPKQAVGRIALFEWKKGDYSFSNFTSAIRIKDTTRVEHRYLHKFLFWTYASGVTERIQSHSTGIRNLDLAAYKAITVPLPPLAEQRRIVAILDEVFKGIATATANAEKNLANARELLRAATNNLLHAGDGWVDQPLGAFCEIYQPTTISKSQMRDDGPYPVFGANGKIGRYVRYNHEVEQLLVTCRGATCGSINMSEPHSWITGNAMVIRPKNGEIRLGLLRQIFRNGFDFSQAITGAAQPQITRRSLAPIKIRFPSDSNEQKKLEVGLDDLEHGVSELCDSYHQKLALLSELKQSILHRAFNGDLTRAEALAA